MRTFRKFDDSISRKTFNSTLLKVVEIMEREIKQEMAGTKGAILYDGWSKNGTHSVGTFAVYSRTVEVFINGKVVQTSVVETPLISVSSMGQVGC